MLLGISFSAFAQDTVPPSPPGLIFWSLQHLAKDEPYPPMPFNPFAGTTVYLLDDKNATYDDRAVDYVQLSEEAVFEAALKAILEPEGPQPLAYGPGDLVLEIADLSPSTVSLRLHNIKTVPGTWYQVLAKNDLSLAAFSDWHYGPTIASGDASGIGDFPPFSLGGEEELFFEVLSAEEMVYIYPGGNAAEGDPNGGSVTVYRSSTRAASLTVKYSIHGTAKNGVDYVSLSGQVTIPAYAASATIPIVALADTELEFDEQVTLQLELVDPDQTSYHYVIGTPSTASIMILDAQMGGLFIPVATDLDEPFGLDYDLASGSLICSEQYSGDPDGHTYNLARIYDNAGSTEVQHKWRDIRDLPGDNKLATGKQEADEGVVYYGNGSPGGIGRLAVDGTHNDNWLTLPNEPNLLRGGLYVDQTGVWNHDLLVVASGPGQSPGSKGVWRVNPSATPPVPTLVASIDTPHLEGAISVPDNPGQWGPWAGKLLTGDEFLAVIYAVSPNGDVQTFDLGIKPEDFDLIPDELVTNNLNLYCVCPVGEIQKLPGVYLEPYQGGMLITQAGENNDPPWLFAARWNGSGFDITGIRNQGLQFEHVTFAPIDLN